MRADYAIRAPGRRGDGVHVQRRRVGRQNRLGLTQRIQRREQLTLSVQVLDNGLDDNIGVCHLLQTLRPRDSRKP